MKATRMNVRWLMLPAAVFIFCHCPTRVWGELYDLAKVNGIQAFGGSDEAKALLAKNGFVVADPAFKQIFEPYISSPAMEEPSEQHPLGVELPVFITTDSAWHTYHVLLEEGVKQMEELQAGRLHEFSRKLLKAATDRNVEPDLILFASVGLALQDQQYRETLTTDAKRIVNGLRTGSGSVEVPFGFPLAAEQFRAQSFYTQSPELSDYFAARQWYGSVVFRLSNNKETKSAVTLALLVNGNSELLALWRQLSEPFDAFLSKAEDGTVPEYASVATAVSGVNAANATVSDGQVTQIQRMLEGELPLPIVNDQLLTPQQYAAFPTATRGFRLLPPRRLPSAVCFQNTVDPKIPNRMYPSGLDFMAASPVLRSAAATRALKSEFGTDSGLILKAECGPMPDSLHGEALRLLASLQKPLPDCAPAALKTQAWSDLQLWTQLAAWAEQRHTWALHTKMTVEYMGLIEPPTGMVAPYPEFFKDLATLTRRTAASFEKAGLEQPFDAKTVAGELSNSFALSGHRTAVTNEDEMEKQMEANADTLEQLNQFQSRYYDQHHAEWEKAGSKFNHGHYQQVEDDLNAMAQRCAVKGTTNDADLATLRLFYDCRQDVVRMIKDFAPVCDRLAELAQKPLDGEALTGDDAQWIKNYGVTLAGFSFYYENSYEVPRDDFPIVTRVYSNPLLDSTLYAGEARPQALYVIVPNGTSLQLYRGAVMTYREFVRPNSQLLDDESWREMVSSGQTPHPPPFTHSFYAETSVRELLKDLRAKSQNEYYDVSDALWQIGSRATDKDLPGLIDLMANSNSAINNEVNRNELVDGTADLITNLNWAPYQKQLVTLMAADDEELAHAAAYILLQKPEMLDPVPLTSSFGHFSSRARRLDCVVLSRIPNRNEVIQETLLHALQDGDDGVRWQAALAVGDSGRGDKQIISALVNGLHDTNQFVVAAASRALGQLGATNTAGTLFSELKKRLPSAIVNEDDWERQSKAVQNGKPKFNGSHIDVLDADYLEFKLRPPAMQNVSLMLGHPISSFNAISSIVTTLGQFQYHPSIEQLFGLLGGDYDVAAVDALKRLAPEELTRRLFAVAKDPKADGTSRVRAIADLSDMEISDRITEFLPLLNDTTPVQIGKMPPGHEWRICDQSAQTVATILKRHVFLSPIVPTERRDQVIMQVRQWTTQSAMPSQ